MPKTLGEKLAGKFPSTTFGHFLVRNVCLDGAFQRILELKASPIEGQSLQQKDRKGERGKAKLKELKRALDVGHFI